MEFFNRKEEVIDIQLTQYGKHLLSKGRFKPKFYAFYDDDMVYDSSYAGFNEYQTKAEDRITTTPRVKAQHAFEGAETRMKKITQTEATKTLSNDEKASLLQQVVPTSTRVYGLSADLGTSAFNSHKAPAWNIRLLEGQISGSIFYTTGSIKIERIPQIDIVSTTRVSVMTEDEAANIIEENIDPSLSDSADLAAIEGASLQLVDSFDDGSSFQVLNDTIIFDIEEFNTSKRQFNFDIEVYEVETDENGNEDLRILRFPIKGDNLVQGLSIETDGDIVSNIIGLNAENKNYTHYYMDVHTDAQVQRTAPPLEPTPSSTILGTPAQVIPANDFDCPDEIDEEV